MLPFRDYNPTRSFPLVTISLIAINVLVFLYMLSLEFTSGASLESFYHRAAFTPAELIADPTSLSAWLTVFSAMFMHAGPVHLLGNMLYLWIFGNNIEDSMGAVRFTIFYLLCGIIATLGHVASVWGDPQAAAIPSLGASGAIAGVLGAYLVRFPRAQVDSCLFVFIFVTVIRLPAIVVLGFWFVLQLFSGVASIVNGDAAGAGVAFWAHIGGFVAGMIFINAFVKDRGRRYNTYT